MKPLAIGACSGSLGSKDLGEALRTAGSLGVEVIQLSGMPHTFGLRKPAEVIGLARQAGVEVISSSVVHAGEDYTTLETIRATGGLVTDFPKRLDDFRRAADWMAEAGMHDATSHVGHIPADPADEGWKVLLERVRQVVDELGRREIRLALETGQETAATLRRFLAELALPNVGINFDPANMILYGQGDPVAALDVIGPHVVSVHCKDALNSERPGQTWGREVPFGDGEVHAEAWLAKLIGMGFRGPLVIEREGGKGRADDVRKAVAICRKARAGVA